MRAPCELRRRCEGRDGAGRAGGHGDSGSVACYTWTNASALSAYGGEAGGPKDPAATALYHPRGHRRKQTSGLRLRLVPPLPYLSSQTNMTATSKQNPQLLEEEEEERLYLEEEERERFRANYSCQEESTSKCFDEEQREVGEEIGEIEREEDSSV
uniref:Uncharacterized protein n=1 Tax=Oryza brachyantha TaxID=4533 RepID=J3LKW5_ORYBR